MNVTYRDLKKYPGYKVGDDGSVWSSWVNAAYSKIRRSGQRGGIAHTTSSWRKLKPNINHGYQSVEMRRTDGVIKRVKVHTLVLEAFVGERLPGYQACHNNGVRDDNRLENLRWGTKEDNAADKVRHGSHKGERHIKAKLTDNDVRDILRLATEGVSCRKLASQYNISVPTVVRIIRGEGWTHIERPTELTRQLEICGGSHVRRGTWMRHATEQGLSFDEYLHQEKRIKKAASRARYDSKTTNITSEGGS